MEGTQNHGFGFTLNTKTMIPIGVLSLVLSVGGRWVSDRLFQENRDSATAARVSELEKRVAERGTDMVHRTEFEQIQKRSESTLSRDEFQAYMRTFETGLYSRIDSLEREITEERRRR